MLEPHAGYSPEEYGFVQSPSDPCIYTSSEGETCLIGVYVDDIVLAGQSLTRIEEVKKALSRRFDVKDLGELNYFLGVQVCQNHENGDVWIGQPTFTESILRKYGMVWYGGCKTGQNSCQHQLQTVESYRGQ